MKRSKGTEIEFGYLLPVGRTSWSSKVNLTKEDKGTSINHVVKILGIFDPLPPFCHFYKIKPM